MYGGPQYTAPAPNPISSEPPQVKLWAKVYNAFMILVYLAVVGFGVFLFVSADSIAKGGRESPEQFRIMGIIYGSFAFVFAIMHVVPFVWRKGMGGWVYQLVIIVLGLTSCCTWPGTIPLMIFWIKDRDRIINS